jgi:predicted RNase H-like HicB family nuclease
MGAEREFEVVILTEPEGGYSVFVPELPSVATQGETIEEARANAQQSQSSSAGGYRNESTGPPVTTHLVLHQSPIARDVPLWSQPPQDLRRA